MSLRLHNFAFAFLMLLLIQPVLHAQADDDWRLYKPKTEPKMHGIEAANTLDFAPSHPQGEIEFIIDNRIKSLNELKIEHPSKPDGYRVQIYFGNRNTAREKRAEFANNYPNHNAYISYLAPNFRLRVGDFRTRLESERFKNEIARDYPGSYIVKDSIELPPLAGELDDELPSEAAED